MAKDLLPAEILNNYDVHEWKHACAILKYDFPDEWADIIAVLTEFKLHKSWIDVGGGRKSKVSGCFDQFLYDRGWVEKNFKTQIRVDDRVMDSPTHKVDCYKNEVAFKIEWNNKDPFFDRDLNNFRLLLDLRAISVGVIITRCDHLQAIFNKLGRGASYGPSTTHLSKLVPRIEGGGAGCPILAFGITNKLYETSDAFLVGVDLSGSSFRKADLRNARLDHAILSRTDFRDANMTNAVLVGARADQHAFDRAILCKTVMPDGTTENRDCHE